MATTKKELVQFGQWLPTDNDSEWLVQLAEGLNAREEAAALRQLMPGATVRAIKGGLRVHLSSVDDNIARILGKGGGVTKATPATKATKATVRSAEAERKADTKAAQGQAERVGGRTYSADVVAALRPAAAHTSKDAARIGEAATAMHGDKALAAYVVRWPHASYDALVRLDGAKGEGSHWLARCNAHGTTAEADTMQGALKQGKRDAMAVWCAGHKAEARAGKDGGAAMAKQLVADKQATKATKAAAAKAEATWPAVPTAERAAVNGGKLPRATKATPAARRAVPTTTARVARRAR